MLSDLIADWTGVGLFSFRLFRAGASALFSAAFVYFLMPHFIQYLIRIKATSDFDEGEKFDQDIKDYLLNFKV